MFEPIGIIFPVGSVFTLISYSPSVGLIETTVPVTLKLGKNSQSDLN